ncbi:hypothetical protein IJT17_02025 [bacterium]|nr:hypothetical protein [bacterium]
MNYWRDVYENKHEGELFEFGRWPQGADGEIRPITWRVLQRQDDHLLAVAEKGLECRQYHEYYRATSWQDCSLRRWLNSGFFSQAFEDAERSLIMLSRVINNACSATEDRIFLLSTNEATSLFADNADRRVKAVDYAVKNGANTTDGYCFWWLRSQGSYAINAADVDSNGVISSSGGNVNYRGSAVRPALRLILPKQ